MLRRQQFPAHGSCSSKRRIDPELAEDASTPSTADSREQVGKKAWFASCHQAIKLQLPLVSEPRHHFWQLINTAIRHEHRHWRLLRDIVGRVRMERGKVKLLKKRKTKEERESPHHWLWKGPRLKLRKDSEEREPGRLSVICALTDCSLSNSIVWRKKAG